LRAHIVINAFEVEQIFHGSQAYDRPDATSITGTLAHRRRHRDAAGRGVAQSIISST
jgi:hypothetical protein